MVNQVSSGVLCLGALNVDELWMETVPRALIELLAFHKVKYSSYAEVVIPDGIVDKLSLELPSPVVAQLGGSAFNVVRMLSELVPNQRLGFIGVAGQTADGGHAHIAFMEDHRIDTRLVGASKRPPGRSIAFTADGDRTLLTSIGANCELKQYLIKYQAELPQYIASFGSIHVTAVHDDTVPPTLAAMLRGALDINPNLNVSLALRHHWAVEAAPIAEPIIAEANILHLTAREFAALGGRLPSEPDSKVVSRVMQLMHEGPRYVVVRRHDSASIYYEDPLSERIISTVPIEVLPTEEVVDATGAGDAFTAGFLAMQTSPFLRAVSGAKIGTALARAKVRMVGPLNRSTIVSVLDQLVAPIEPAEASSGESERDLIPDE